MARPWVWLQLIIGWLPVWAMYSLLVSPANPIHSNAPLGGAVIRGLIAVSIAAALGLLVQRFTDRLPWPHPFRAGFVAIHLLAAALYSIAWHGLKGGIEFLIHRDAGAAFHFLLLPSFVLGVWLYVMVAGVSYAARATERAARAEAIAARSQLAALRGQLNPHFLFNALHTVVQLIPRQPKEAAQAAERIAGLLRTAIEEDRDLISLAEERSFVERYLELERIRFGDRLRVTIRTNPETEHVLVPSFALQTLVENAVRHGAAPNLEPTEIVIEARLSGGLLSLTVSDTGSGARGDPVAKGGGTGLSRLRERLEVLYGSEARLTVSSGAAGGFAASLTLPEAPADEATWGVL